jgi:hypothetical protein
VRKTFALSIQNAKKADKTAPKTAKWADLVFNQSAHLFTLWRQAPSQSQRVDLYILLPVWRCIFDTKVRAVNSPFGGWFFLFFGHILPYKI